MPREMTVVELARKQAAGDAVLLLDVRQPDEHAFAALPQSLLVPLPELPERHHEIQPPPGAALIVYCHHGVRSWQAAHFLEQNGFADVWSLADGIDAWSRQIDPRIPRY